jgi:hypothetical protein
MRSAVIGTPKTADRLAMALAVATGFASMGLFAYGGRPTLVPLGWTPAAPTRRTSGRPTTAPSSIC